MATHPSGTGAGTGTDPGAGAGANGHDEDETGSFSSHDAGPDDGEDEDVAFEEGDVEQILALEEGDGDDAMEEDDEDQGEGGGDAAPALPLVDHATRVLRHSPREPVFAVALRASDGTIVTGGGDDRALVWGPASGPTPTPTLLAKHSDSVAAVGFSSDGALVASGGMDGTVRVADGRTFAPKLTLEGPSREVEWLAFHPAGPVVLAGSADGTAWMWDATTGDVMSVFSGHADLVTCGAFTPNGRRVVTASLDGTMRLWDPRTGQCLHTFSGHGFHEAGVLCLDFAPTGEPTIATGGQDGCVCVSRLDSRKTFAVLPHAEPRGAGAGAGAGASGPAGSDEGEEVDVDSVESVAFCAGNPAWLASAGTDGRVVVWDWIAKTRRCAVQPSVPAPVIRVLWLKASTALAAASSDGAVRVWDARSGGILAERTGHADAILDMVVSPDGTTVVTGSEDGTCRVFDVRGLF